MLLARFRNVLLIGSMFLLGMDALHAQNVSAPRGPNTAPRWQPFGPVDTSDDHNYRPFEAADLSEYGNGPKLHSGWFFGYEHLIWAFNSPNKVQIGDVASQGILNNDNITPAFPINIPPLDFLNINTLDTSFIKTDWVQGNRYELGYMEDNTGWLVSAAHVKNHVQNLAASDVTVAFFDPFNVYQTWIDTNADGRDEDFDGDGIFGNTQPFNVNLPPPAYVGPDYGDLILMAQRFRSFFTENETRYSTIELMHLNRLDTFHNGSTLEMMFGVRFVNLTDNFLIRATGGSGSIDSFTLDNHVNNYIFGPQIGARYYRQTGRWNVGSQARFTAAANFHQIDLNGSLVNRESFRSDLFYSGTFNDSVHETTFTPLGEIRFDVNFQLTKAIYLHGGYTGTFVGGITRASERIEYVLPKSNILDDNKREWFIANGIDFGITINR